MYSRTCALTLPCGNGKEVSTTHEMCPSCAASLSHSSWFELEASPTAHGGHTRGPSHPNPAPCNRPPWIDFSSTRAGVDIAASLRPQLSPSFASCQTQRKLLGSVVWPRRSQTITGLRWPSRLTCALPTHSEPPAGPHGKFPARAAAL